MRMITALRRSETSVGQKVKVRLESGEKINAMVVDCRVETSGEMGDGLASIRLTLEVMP